MTEDQFRQNDREFIVNCEIVVVNIPDGFIKPKELKIPAGVRIAYGKCSFTGHQRVAIHNDDLNKVFEAAQ